MALDQLIGDEGLSAARAKLNAAIAQADRVATLAGTVAGQGQTLAAAVVSINSLATSAAAAAEAITGLTESANAAAEEVAGLSRAVLGSSLGTRPGDYPTLFTPAVAGAGPGLPELDPAGCIPSAAGNVYRLTGAGIVALRAAVWLEPDAFWSLRLQFRRLVNAVDPNNHAVDVSIQWLDGSYQPNGISLVQRYSHLRPSDGPVHLTVRVPSLAGEVPAIVPPNGAVFWRPYLRTFGNDGETAVEFLVVSDVTNAGVFAPDVSALAARMSALEGVIEAGIPFSTPILPSYAVADLPTPATPGRKAFASDGRAPNAAGTLEGANAGTGVEVVDNGSAWVISGTNQAVQS